MTGRLHPDATQLAAALAPLGKIVSVDTLSGGTFATALRVVLDDGRAVVAKIVSSDNSGLMRYEWGIMETEARIYEMLSGSGVPVPRVLLTDFSRTHLAGDLVVTEFLPGVSWSESKLDEQQTEAVRRRLGAVMADAHRVTAPSFGYPAEVSGLSAPSWEAALSLMVEAVFDDADRAGIELPVERVRAALHTHRDSLAEVTQAAVVHADLWEGNIFLDPQDHTIVGVIDTERTVWGDPLLDLVGSAQFSSAEPSVHILEGNAAAQGILAAELARPGGPARLHLCRMYFAMLLVAEKTVRGYEGESAVWHETTARACLDAALIELDALASA